MDESQSNGKNYTVSIIIATCNAGENIRACLNSIISQSADGIEIIVVDGGSTDQTIPILQSVQHPSLKWTTGKDEGIYDALNKGTKIARGKWFYFLGSDDLLLPGFSKIIAKLVSPKTVYYGIPEPYYLPGRRPDYELLSGKFSRYKLAKYPLNHQSILYPRAVFRKYSYQPDYPVFADYALNLQVWGDTGFERKFYPIPIVKYNMTGFSSSVRDTVFAHDKPQLIKENLGLFTYYRWLWKTFKKKMRGETF
jgi:glycosyltransferase involved in cell wall biosynthesis